MVCSDRVSFFDDRRHLRRQVSRASQSPQEHRVHLVHGFLPAQDPAEGCAREDELGRLVFAKFGLYDPDLCQPDQQEEGCMQIMIANLIHPVSNS